MGAFGQKLQQERERKGITLDEIALATKIGTRMLRAIEEEDFDRLPGGIFNKGFVRAYARHLGLNEEQVVTDYLSALAATQPQPPPESQPKPLPPLPLLRSADLGSWGKLAAALLLLAVILGFWNLRSRNNSPKSAPLSTKLPSAAAPERSSVKHERPAAPTVPAADSSSQTPSPRAPSPTPETTTDSEISQPAAGLFHVLIRAREDSWLLVTADGKEVMQDTLLADGQRYVAAQKEVVVRSGNIGGLEFWFNGQKLPPQGGLDQVKTLTFNARGLMTPTARIQAPISGGETQP